MKASSSGVHFQFTIRLDPRLAPAVTRSLTLNNEKVVGELLPEIIVARLAA
jgi:hypothetical protein